MSVSVNTHFSDQIPHQVSHKPVIQQIPPEIWAQLLEYTDLDYKDLSSIWWVCKSNPSVLKNTNVIGMIVRQILAYVSLPVSLQISLDSRRYDKNDHIHKALLKNKMIGIIRTLLPLAGTIHCSVTSLHLPMPIFKSKFNDLLKQLPLPSTLTHLALSSPYYEYPRIDLNQVSLLPKSLMNLDLRADIFLDQVSDGVCSLHWPPNLTELSLGAILLEDNSLRDNSVCDFSLLPQNLTCLDTMGIFKGKFNDLSRDIKEKVLKGLPKTLKHLIIRDKVRRDNDGISRTKRFLDVLDKNLIANFPGTLSTLELHGITKIQLDNDSTVWPPNLKRICFPRLKNIDEFLINSLSTLSAIKELSLALDDETDIRWMKNFTNLEVLRLRSRALLSGIDHLPSSLKELYLPSYPWLKIGEIKTLGNLEVLDLGICLEGDDLKKLPAFLRTLRISGSKLQNEDLQNLPKLTHLTIEDDQITDAGMKYLPRSLMTLVLPDNMTITPDSRADWPKFLQLQVSKENIHFVNWRTRVDQLFFGVGVKKIVLLLASMIIVDFVASSYFRVPQNTYVINWRNWTNQHPLNTVVGKIASHLLFFIPALWCIKKYNQK